MKQHSPYYLRRNSPPFQTTYLDIAPLFIFFCSHHRKPLCTPAFRNFGNRLSPPPPRQKNALQLKKTFYYKINSHPTARHHGKPPPLNKLQEHHFTTLS
ncbi:hypothetical protein PVAND_015056 [Polypedilum vanderplanki]|uniref:Uncharacterized protein n=1 Tax=Polypedilum vanderplanki TaxID=319348 RepID=A0A9J6BBW6_POLVA|nr:hypothetical protein PVAND_015056 [Polypedilum vanderplanki]